MAKAVLAILVFSLACSAAGGVAVNGVPDAASAAPAHCPAIAQDTAAAGAIRWVRDAAPVDREVLDAWCRGVGAAVVTNGAAARLRLDSLLVLTWNTHVGGGDVDALVADLRSGAVTGVPVRHFALLLQEVRRDGDAVPATLPRNGRAPRRIAPPHASDARDIVATARRLGLALFYVPSMRNGNGGGEAADRGNAILTTLDLVEPTAIELPLEAQRRVAVAATLRFDDAAGRRRQLRVASVHLDHRSRVSRILESLGAGRERQARAVIETLASDSLVVLGGDLNTWATPPLEGALALLRSHFPHLSAGPDEPTFLTAGVFARRLDHLFLRAAGASGTAPVRIAARYGSDHYPLFTWIRFAAAE
jgi:endonuclease/exonuclease/phosphatase family metal-dependent hydrolase